MLVLSRRLGESLIIADNITVTILGISGNQVRLGIGAPESISIHREEVHRRIHGEQPVDEPASPASELPASPAARQFRRTALGVRRPRA